MTASRKIDWNDLHVEFGLDVVREQLQRAAANAPLPRVRTAGEPDAADDLPRPHPTQRQPLVRHRQKRGPGRLRAGRWRR